MLHNKAPDYESFKKTSFFPSLDGLRAIAVVLVLCVHFGGKFGTDIGGQLGVEIFFVLSGFLITTLLLREQEEFGSVSLGAFYIKRVFRIMPVYYLVFALVIWQSLKLPGWWDMLKHAAPYFALFSGELVHFPTPWLVVWSLGIEWKFYLVWPIIAFIVARNDRARFGVAALTLVVLFASWNWHEEIQLREYIQLLYGAFLAMLMNTRRGYALAALLMRPRAAIAVFLSFVAFQAMTGCLVEIFWVPNEYDHRSILFNLYALAVVPLIPAILGAGLPQKLLSSKPFVFVGKRSYSLYLIQPFAQQAVMGIAPWNTPGVWQVIQVLIVGLVMADVLLRYVEKPAIAFGHRFAEKLGGRRHSEHVLQHRAVSSGSLK